MKNLLILLSLVSLTFASCGDDETCDAGTFESNIIGTWDTPAIASSVAGTVTFNADGTGVGTEDGLFYSELNGEGSGNFDWSYNTADDNMTIDWNFSNGALGVDMAVVSFDCDNTTFNFVLDFTIERQ